ncbi:MAG: hypothetical protein QOJ72_616 [Nocardioidaceae bacterium]|nr:hypothetical protein [Nocardioidaceae bacterium]
MNGVPTVFRLWLLGILWATGSGAATGTAVMLVASTADLGDFTGFGLVIGIPLLALYAGLIGGTIGLLIGVPTGLLAGLTLTASSPNMQPRTAVWTTVVVVLVAQIAAEVAVVGPPHRGTLWAFCVVPVITAFPLWREAGRAARKVSPRGVSRRDTLAA